MAAIRETTNLVDQAIQNHKDLWIRYRNLQTTLSEEVISPFEWIDDDKTLFRAYCHMRTEESLFNIFMIVEARLQESPIDREAAQPDESIDVKELSRIAPLLARAINKTDTGEEAPLPAPEIIKGIDTAQSWRKLLRYYNDCLQSERLARSTIQKKDLYNIALDNQEAIDFFRGKIDLQFTLNFRHWQQSFINFVDPARHPEETLCFGTQFFCLDENTVIPLLFCTISTEYAVENQALIKPSISGINIAPWALCGWSQEEISTLLKQIDLLLEPETPVNKILEFFQSRLSGLYNNPVQLLASTNFSLLNLPEHALFDGSGLFWLKQETSSFNLSELEELSNENYWNSAPDAVLSLLNRKEISSQPAVIDPNQFCISNLNVQQREAAASAGSKPIILIGGPPGTGKTQLLANILLQAFLDGKTVLITSAYRQAVDILYSQIAEQLQFPGILRAGRFDQRLQMTKRIDRLIAQTQKQNISDYKEEYSAARQAFLSAEETLNLTHDLHGRRTSYQTERDKIRRLLPEAIVQKVSQLSLPYDENEKQLFLEVLNRVGDQVRALINARSTLLKQLQTAVAVPGNQHPAAQTIKEYEERWGPLGGDDLALKHISRMEDLIIMIQRWLDLLAALEAKREQDVTQLNLHNIEQKSTRSLQKLEDAQRQQALRCADQYPRASLVSAHKNLAEIQTELEKRATEPSSWPKIIANRIKARGNTSQRFITILLQLGWSDLAAVVQHNTTAEQIDLCSKVHAVIRCAILLQKAKENSALFEAAQAKYSIACQALPERTCKDIPQMNLANFNSESLTLALFDFQKEANAILQQRKIIADKITQIITQNSLRLQWLQKIQEAFSGPERAFFKINAEISESQLEQYLRIWRRIAWLWEIDSILNSLSGQKNDNIDQSRALSTYQDTLDKFVKSGMSYLSASWMDRAARVSSVTLQGLQRYSLAVQEEELLDDNQLEKRLFTLKELQRDNFPHILRLFPIWIACTEDVPANFPLTSELFDIVIIDQADMIGLPQAFSLLYRARNIVIAGDTAPHPSCAQINRVTDHQIAEYHQIDPELFSYHDFSLFDLVQKAVYQSVFLLNHHYRSDARIATFIGKEFYQRPLSIETDLVKLGYQAQDVQRVGGIFWLDVKGFFEHQMAGSGENRTEIEHIQELVNSLAVTNTLCGIESPSIGILTPFRSQAAQVKEWVAQSYPSNSNIYAGSPLELVGKELDIVIFSSVVSSGVPKDMLEGIELSNWMLNLAASRAKVALIVVGDWHFCYTQLDAKNSYHQLARYVFDKGNSVFDSLSHLPLLGGSDTCSIGFFSNPADPLHSRTTLEQLILSRKGQILWIDPHLDAQIIEFLDEVIDRDKDFKPKEIRLVTAEKQVTPQSGKPVLPIGMLENFARYLGNLGIKFEIRTNPAQINSERGIIHDFTETILLPQFLSAHRKHRLTSEFQIAHASPKDLELLWESASRLDLFTKPDA